MVGGRGKRQLTNLFAGRYVELIVLSVIKYDIFFWLNTFLSTYIAHTENAWFADKEDNWEKPRRKKTPLETTVQNRGMRQEESWNGGIR